MPKSSFNGIWNKFDAFTPPTVRVLACRRILGNAEALTDEEISRDSGLSVKRIQAIYWSKTWDKIPMGEVKAFFKGCGYDLNDSDHVKMLTSKLKKNTKFKWRHLRRSENHRLFQQLLKFALEK